MGHVNAGGCFRLTRERAITAELRELLPPNGLDFEVMEIGGHFGDV